MTVSDEERRWLVVGIAMNKVAAPVLRDYIKQEMDTHYAHNSYCHGLTTPCTMATLTYHHVNADPNLRRLKFQNINNNVHNHGNRKSLYNYNINSSVDLAKLFLPDYLAEFSAFDESLDMSPILRLFGFNNPAPIFHSPNPLISIQTSADDVRENVRNNWGHCNVSHWTELFFNDCFSKLETLVRSLGLSGGMEKTTLDQLSDWQTKGCQLCMGHAVDKSLLSLVQIEVKGMIRDFTQQSKQLSVLQEQLSAEIARSSKCDARLDAAVKELQEEAETRKKEVESILERLISTEAEVLRRVGELEDGLAATNVMLEEQQLSLTKTDARVDQVEKGFAKTESKLEELRDGVTNTEAKLEGVQKGLAKTDDKVEEQKLSLTKTDAKVDELEEGFAKTVGELKELHDGITKIEAKLEGVQEGLAKRDDKVEQLESEFKSLRAKDANPVDSFDVETCRGTLADHYKRTATVPTSVWSKKSAVDIHQIYTRLSWVKEEQSPAGSSKSELGHYTDLFTAKKKGVVPKRILVQGETGIGKSTFVKKLAVDWAELDDQKKEDEEKKLEGEENISKESEGLSQCESISGGDHEDTSNESDDNTKQKEALKKFEILLVFNLREVSKYQKLQDMIRHSHVFPEEDTALTEGLLSYITRHQEKVLLVFDGYDEYRFGRDSEIYEIFRGNKLRHCCVLITTRISKADELQEFKDEHAEITGFSEEDREAFMSRILGSKKEAGKLVSYLSYRNLTELARVPLLLLFLCTLWKKGKYESFPDSKTKLYVNIVQCALDHSQRKRSPARFRKLEDYKEILAEIGKVALECLLKGDHIFEYDQLSSAILGEESLVIGLLQVTEYSENLRPAAMVSFFHKSIQEFLAALYITYRCVPEGSLGKIEQHARTISDCEAFGNVFQFVSGLSEDGAVKVSRHLTSVRISEYVFSKATPDDENEINGIRLPRAITELHKRFNSFVLNAFREVRSTSEFVRHCFGSTGGFILASRSFFGRSPKMKDQVQSNYPKMKGDFHQVSHSGMFLFVDCKTLEDMYQWLRFLDCLHLPVQITENSEVVSVRDFLKRFDSVDGDHGFNSILSFHDGQFHFYISDLELNDDAHARRFTETTSKSVPC